MDYRNNFHSFLTLSYKLKVSIVRLNNSSLYYFCHLLDRLEDVSKLTPRKTSRARDSLFTSTPEKGESTEMAKRSSSSTRTGNQKSRQLNEDFNDGNNNVETGEQSIHSKSAILNHNTSMFDDKPKHLYGKYR